MLILMIETAMPTSCVMTNSQTAASNKGLDYAKRKARLYKQIAALEAMDYAVWKKMVFCAASLIAGISLGIWGGIFYYTGNVPWLFLCATPFIVLFGIFAMRNWVLMLWLAVVVGFLALVSLIFEDAVGAECVGDAARGLDTSLDVLDWADDRKSKARRKIEMAIQRRKQKLLKSS